MRGFWLGVVVASCVASGTTLSRAGISVTDQSRLVHIEGGGDGGLFPSRDVTAAPNLPFDSSIQDSGPSGSPNMQTARASQTSSFGLTGTTFHASMVGSAGTSGLADNPAIAGGNTGFSLTFVLDTPGTFHITANTSYAGPQTAFATVSLSRGGSDIFKISNGNIAGLPDPTGFLNTGGTLPAGTYVLLGGTTAGGEGDASADVNFNFIVTPIETASVPLPPAAYAGAIVLALVFGATRFDRRRGLTN